MEDDIFIYLVIAIAIGLFVSPMIDPVNTYFSNLKDSIVSFFENYFTYILIFGIVFLLIGILIYFVIKRHIRIRNKKRKRQDHIDYLIINIKKYLGMIITCFESEDELIKIINDIKELKNEAGDYSKLSYLINPLNKKLSIFQERYNKIKRQREKENFKAKEEKIREEEEERRKSEAERLRNQEYNKELYQKENDETLTANLNINENQVFKINKVKVSQREALLRLGYRQLNEYDLVERKIITVLVRPPLNHSPTHTFLVWSAKRLLKKFKGVSSIIDHDTKFADITFKFNNKYYALEIETGSLIFHKKRLEEKVKFLDSKFNGKWFFIVSNKTLVSKYRKFGSATQRSEVEKRLSKMLEKV